MAPCWGWEESVVFDPLLEMQGRRHIGPLMEREDGCGLGLLLELERKS